MKPVQVTAARDFV